MQPINIMCANMIKKFKIPLTNLLCVKLYPILQINRKQQPKKTVFIKF